MNLIVLNNFVLEVFKNKSQIDVIFTDFAKAFDRVDHIFLLEILYKSGFGFPLLAWFKFYLSGRFQYVKVYSCRSDVLPITSRVPQGVDSFFPTYFLHVYQWNKKVIPKCNFLAFVDDLKIFRQVQSIDNYFILQSELDKLVLWFNSIELFLNIDKCQLMSLSQSKIIILYTYTINALELISVSNIRYLGILVTSNLNYHDYIRSITYKAYKTLGL